MNAGQGCKLPLKPDWQTAAMVLLLLLPFNLFLFPARHTLLTRLSGRENIIIDVWFAYTPQQVYDVLPLYGPTGRLLYAASELSIDVLYPLLYSTLLWMLMAVLFSRLLHAPSRLHRLQKLPILLFCMDILENCGISALLLIYPRQLNWLAWITSGFATLKFMLGTLVMGIILFAGLVLAWQRFRGWVKNNSRPAR